MTDIALCSNKDCPLKDSCYRFTAKPEEYQWYADFDEDDCEFYIYSIKTTDKN